MAFAFATDAGGRGPSLVGGKESSTPETWPEREPCCCQRVRPIVPLLSRWDSIRSADRVVPAESAMRSELRLDGTRSSLLIVMP